MQAQLLPLQRLKVREVAKVLGTSETPVREALIQLSREGAIEIKPRYYIRVRRLSAAEYEEIRAIRLELEPMAAERALPHITPDVIDQLEEIHRRLIASEQSANWPEALQTNFDFHFKLYRLSGMQHLLDMLEALWMRTGPILSELYPHAMPAYAGPHQHEVVLNALRRTGFLRPAHGDPNGFDRGRRGVDPSSQIRNRINDLIHIQNHISAGQSAHQGNMNNATSGNIRPSCISPGHHLIGLARNRIPACHRSGARQFCLRLCRRR